MGIIVMAICGALVGIAFVVVWWALSTFFGFIHPLNQDQVAACMVLGAVCSIIVMLIFMIKYP
jgi:hypothetical protein